MVASSIDCIQRMHTSASRHVRLVPCRINNNLVQNDSSPHNYHEKNPGDRRNRFLRIKELLFLLQRVKRIRKSCMTRHWAEPSRSASERRILAAKASFVAAPTPNGSKNAIYRPRAHFKNPNLGSNAFQGTLLLSRA